VEVETILGKAGNRTAETSKEMAWSAGDLTLMDLLMSSSLHLRFNSCDCEIVFVKRAF